MTDIQNATRLLRERFGFSAFREGQEAIISRLLAGRATLAILPTGAGKSLCYQLPSLCLDGLTLVVSPLIALMKDQLDGLRRLGVAAARYDSTISREEAATIRADLERSALTLLYIAPERLADERFRRLLERRPPVLLAIDEAHCISEWGHNFRPDYLRLAHFARALRISRILALTATATPAVASQIAESLAISREDVVRTTFHRRNLTLHVTPDEAGERDEYLARALATRPPGSTVVYVTLQRTAEDLAGFLVARGINAMAYHAGLDDELRHRIQDTFMTSKDGVIVATIAFGMGIDKADIRYVYHYNLPKSLESYSQEIGRAGRDSLPALCELLVDPNDCTVLDNFTYGDTPGPEEVGSFLAELLFDGSSGSETAFDLSVYDLSSRFDLKPIVVETLLAYLELEGLIEPLGAFYAEYQLHLKRPPEDIAAQFDERRQEFLLRFFASGKQGKKWITIHRAQSATELATDPDRIAKTVEYLEEKGFLESKPAGARRRFRRLVRNIDQEAVTKRLTHRFLQHERRQIDRIDEILAYASTPMCRTAYLLQYYGEEGLTRCGHCDRCAGVPAVAITRPVRTLTESERALLRATNERLALSTPRRIARFLCGMTSPSFTRSKLTRDPDFGSLAVIPFGEVLEEAELLFEGSR